MKLTSNDKEYLLKCGYKKEDFQQIEKALGICKYELSIINNEDYSTETISAQKAKNILGDEIFISGISRAAFHFTSSREKSGCSQRVRFDCSRMFK